MKKIKALTEDEIKSAIKTDTVAIHYRKMIASTRSILGDGYATRIEDQYKEYLDIKYRQL